MGKVKSEAERLLEELRVIPKLIKQVEEDIEAMKKILLSSPSWSDMRVTGGVRKSQEDKNIAIIDLTSHNIKRIERLVERQEYILSLIDRLPDLNQRSVLFVSYARCETLEEAIITLDMAKGKFYTLKRQGIEAIQGLLDEERGTAHLE